MAAHLLPLISLMVATAQADSHTLRYYYTAVSAPGSGLPVYSAVGYVDDQEIANYNSDTRQMLPKVEWMKKLEADYWEENTIINRGNEPAMKRNVQIVMNRLNQTGGLHIVQMMRGCELRDDGSTAGFEQHGYDGRDFMYLDTQSVIYIPTMNEAQLSTQRLNSPEVRWGERQNNDLEEFCIDWLKKYINNGQEDLERRVRPEVEVWGRQSEGVTKLHCLAYGFHPRAVDVKWVRNGEYDVIPMEAKTVLPHPDGTYQLRVSVEVPTNEEDTYSCHVDHSSLGSEILKVKWEPDNGLPSSVIAVAVTTRLAALAAVIAGVIVCMNWRRGYKSTSSLAVDPMAVPPVGSATWRDASYRTIRLAQDLRPRPFTALPSSIHRGATPQDKTLQRTGTRGPQPTPPPYNRDLIIQTCNAFCRGYMRETRSSLFILRQALWETDRHIHRLQKERDKLERAHANTRRDLVTNNETSQVRSARPATERYPDKVDVLLQEERNGLLDLKRHSERQLQDVSRQLQALQSHREKLSEYSKEKGRVLDIISENGRPQSRGPETTERCSLLGPENKDCQAAIHEALLTSERFRNTQPPNWQKPTDRLDLKESVTHGLRRKAEETSLIREDVTLALGEVRNGLQRQQRIHEELDTSYQLQLGPVSSLDLSVRERLDRPLVRILQRHPGTQLPEGTLISQGSDSLRQSLGTAGGRIDSLKVTQMKLQVDQENKLWGERLDRAAARLRVKSAKGKRERLCL